MQKKTQILILLAVILAFSAFSYIYAADAGTTGKRIVSNLKESLLPVGTGLVVVSFLVSGIMFLVSGGNPLMLTIAKGALVTGGVGTAIILTATSACPMIRLAIGEIGFCAQSTEACNYTYSDWSPCESGKQKRTIISVTPEGCVGNPGALEKSCQVPCTDYKYSDWGPCENGKQIRTLVESIPPGCTGTAPGPFELSCAPECRAPDADCGNVDVAPDALAGTADHCYAHYTCAKILWEDSKKACNDAGGHLVTITSRDEQDIVLRLNKFGWIGLQDKSVEGNYQWVTGEEFSYSAWNSSQPNNSWQFLDDNADCVENLQGAGKWNDYNCDNPPRAYVENPTIDPNYRINGYICEYEPTTYCDPKMDGTVNGNGSSYQHFSCPGISYDKAKGNCEDVGGHLATITSGEEQQTVLELGKYGWIGLDDRSREGAFQWVTEEPVSYIPPWGTSNPDNDQWNGQFPEGEDCVDNFHFYGKLADYPCSNPSQNSPGGGSQIPGYICEFSLVCETFDYSDWGPCENGQRSRTVIHSYPEGCTGGSPGPLTESCSEESCAPKVNCGSYGGSSIASDAHAGTEDHCYAHYTCNGITYETAESACSTAGGHLTTITSSSEQGIVFGLEKFGWIGLSDRGQEGTYQWSTGEPFSYSAWSFPPQPDNKIWHSAGGEDCVENYFYGSGAALWNDYPCDNPTHEVFTGLRVPGFICEFEEQPKESSCIPGTRCLTVISPNGDEVCKAGQACCDFSWKAEGYGSIPYPGTIPAGYDTSWPYYAYMSLEDCSAKGMKSGGTYGGGVQLENDVWLFQTKGYGVALPGEYRVWIMDPKVPPWMWDGVAPFFESSRYYSEEYLIQNDIKYDYSDNCFTVTE